MPFHFAEASTNNRLKLYKGNLITAGRKSALLLYRPDIATMESGESVCAPGPRVSKLLQPALDGVG